jgi:hypothetical protein
MKVGFKDRKFGLILTISEAQTLWHRLNMADEHFKQAYTGNGVYDSEDRSCGMWFDLDKVMEENDISYDMTREQGYE